MRLKIYYRKHLRSIFISKFFYKVVHQVIRLQPGFLQLGFKKNNNNFVIAFLFLFFFSNSFPTVSVKFDFIRGRKKIKFKFLSVIFREKRFFIFLERLIFFYFVFLES